MLKALECRYDSGDKPPSCSSQPPLADSEVDVASSSTSCADSGRGLSCEVHDEPAKTLTAPGRGMEHKGCSSEPMGRCFDVSGRHPEHGLVTEPVGRYMKTFGRGTEMIGRGLETTTCRGNTRLTAAEALMAHSAALDACHQLPIRSTVNIVGSAGMDLSVCQLSMKSDCYTVQRRKLLEVQCTFVSKRIIKTLYNTIETQFQTVPAQCVSK